MAQPNVTYVKKKYFGFFKKSFNFIKYCEKY